MLGLCCFRLCVIRCLFCLGDKREPRCMLRNFFLFGLRDGVVWCGFVFVDPFTCILCNCAALL